MLVKVAGAVAALFALSKLTGAKEPSAPTPDIREPIVEPPTVVLPPAEPPIADHVCYRGYKIYTSPHIPASVPNNWGIDYPNFFFVYYDSPIFNVTGEKPFWTGSATLAEAKLGIDLRITAETPYKSNPEGTQC